MKSKEVRNLLGITSVTLSKYANNGTIGFTAINKYHYIYNDDDVYKLIGQKTKKYNKTCVSYSRVSTTAQKSQLVSQSERIYNFSITNGLTIETQFEEIASGMNNDRIKFNKMIQLVIQNKVDTIIIENKDRLIRFGFGLLENVFKFFGCKIIVINDQVSNKSYENELTEDLVAIIHHFSMKMYSNRRKLNKMKKELLETIK